MANPAENKNIAVPEQEAPATEKASAEVIDDVCIIVSGDAANSLLAPVVIEKPAAGEDYSLVIEHGKKYFFDFQEGDVASFTQKGSDVTVAFKDGSTILLQNYAEATTGDAAAAFSFSDQFSQDLIKIVDTTPDAEELIAPKAKGEQHADAQDAQAQKVAQVEPAAGDDAAQKLANIEPAAGDTGGGEGARGGYGYQSSFDAQGVIPLVDVGPIGPTALQYGVNFNNDILFFQNPNDVPNIGDNPALGSGIENVDETNILPQTVNGAVSIDFGDDGAGSFGANGGFTSSAGLTSNGVAVTVTQTATGYIGTAGGTTVFQITINGNGAYSFTQSAPLDHPDSTNPDDVISLNFGIQIFDVDGDTDTGNIVINVFDDGPELAPDAAFTIDEANIGPASVSGDLGEYFGEDGPGDIHPNGDAMATGDFTGPDLTSGGDVVVISTTATGYEGIANGVKVFEITIHPLTGEYTFTLHQALDHSVGGDTITLTFGAEIIDNDGDTAEASIVIHVTDDVPNIGDIPAVGAGIETIDETNVLPETTVGGTLVIDYGSDTPGTLDANGNFTSSTPLTSHGVAVTVTHDANGYTGTANGVTVFHITVQDNGQYSFTQFEPLDHPVAGNPNDLITLNFGVTIKDSDGDTDTGSITINILDDGPALAADAAKIISEHDIGPVAVNGDLVEHFGEDGPGNIHANGAYTATGDIAGPNLTSNGNVVTVTATATGYVGVAAGVTVFEVTINQTTGAYVFTLHQPLDHSAGGSTITLNFGAEIVDFDGDKASANIVIKVTDDVPHIPDVPAVGSGIENVDETNLGPITVDGHINLDFGNDGAGTFGGNGNFSSSAALTSHGNVVSVTQTATGYIGTANGATIFEITINANGDYSFTQTGVLDHPIAGNPNDVISLNFGIQISDSDGDTDTGNIVINVFDDGPAAVNDTNSVASLNPINGNVLANDSFGHDGPGRLVSVTFNGTTTPVAAGGSANIVGLFGTLHIESNGSYTYTPKGGVDGTDTFTYGMNDFDGDTSSANLSILVDVDYCPILVQPEKVVVDETNMNPTTSVSDSVQADFGTDGPGTFSGTGSFTGGPFTSHGQPVGVSFNAGTGTYTGTAGGNTVFTLVLQPNGNYTYTLIGTLDHPVDGPTAADHNDGMDMQFGVRATDADGDTATGTITVRVLDDGPTAVNDGSFANSLAPVNGNVLANDSFGKDGAGAVQSVTLNGVTTNIAPGGSANIIGTYGTLHINSNGTYTYTPKGGVDGTDKFSYTMNDYDGDTASANLEIRVTVDSCPILVQPEKVVVDETNMNPTTSVSDTIQANFGNDGPGSFTGNGGFSGGPFTSHGQPVTVSYNAATKTYTGTAGGSSVFTLVIQSNGAYTYTLLKVLDHPVDGPTPTDHNDPMDMQFGITATDSDGDTASGTITVRVLDDGPVAVNDGSFANSLAPVNGNVLANDSFGKDGAGAVISVNINGVTKLVPNGGSADIDGVYGKLHINSNGTYTYTPKGGADGTDAFGYTMNDYDGDTASACLTIQVNVDSCPILVQPEKVVVDETNMNPNTSVSDTIQANFGNDGPGSFTGNGGFSGGPFTSHGQPVTVSYNAATKTYTGVAGGANVFTLVIQSNGAYTYTLLKVLDHPVDGPTAADHNDGMNMQFGITATDSDGDTASGTITVRVLDDGPVAVNDGSFANSLAPVNGNVLTNDSFGKDGAGAVISVNINGTTKIVPAGGSADIDGVYGKLHINSNGTYTYTPKGGADGTDAFGYTMNDYDGDTASACLTIQVNVDSCPILVQPEKVVVDETNMNPNTSVSDTIQANFGNDGPGSFSGNGGFSGGPFTSHGQPVTVSYNAATKTYTGTAGGSSVFTLVIQSNGAYTYTLLKVLDHPVDGPTAADHNDGMDMQFGITATDSDGDVATGTITVRVLDDGPVAVNDGNFVNSNVPVLGNVLANDSFGKDGAGAVISVNINGTTKLVTAGGSADIDGTYGKLHINSDGTYTYTPKNGADGVDQFGYTMKDYDGDTASACLTIEVNIDNCPIIVKPDMKIVDETNLGPIVVNGHVDANFFGDGPGVFKSNGIFQGGFSLSYPLNISYNAGTGTYTCVQNGVNVATMQIRTDGTYTFTLLQSVDHLNPNDPNDPIDFSFGFFAQDADGDKTAGEFITIRILDDGPTAVNDSATAHNLNPINGNVVANDSYGQDGAGALVGVSFNGGAAVAVAAGSSVVINGAYGQLQIHSDGHYTYTPSGANSGTDQFTYTIQDSDGDKASAKLTIDYTCPIDVKVHVDDNGICIKEDGQGTVPVHATYTGGDGDEVMTLVLTGVKPGWTITAPGWTNTGGGSYTITLAPGQKTYDGNITFKPPANSDVDLNGLNVKATVFDPDTNTTDEFNDGFDVNVGASTDTPTLNVSDIGLQMWYYNDRGYTVPMNVSSSVTDTDGSEQITKIVIKLNNPFTNGAAPYYTLDDMGIGLNKGTEVSPGVWEIAVNAGNTATALNGLALTVPSTYNYYAIHETITGHHLANITVETHAKEVILSGNNCDCACGNEVIVIKNLCITFGITPLVVDLDRDGVEVVGISANVTFDMTNDGIVDHTSWVHKDDGLLAIDLNHDGVINNQHELFGDTAEHADGFANLGSYDLNHDGVINVADDVFAKLLIWQDTNQDGISQTDELYSLNDFGIVGIDLNATQSGHTVADSIITHESTVQYNDGSTGQIADIAFNVQDSSTLDVGVTLHGSDGKDVIYGTASNDIIISGEGYRDVLFGGDGNDTFVISPDHDGGLDIIKDFHVGDVLDISGLLTGYDPVTDAINDFVFKTEANGNTTISVDADGAAGPGVAIDVVTLEGVTGMTLDQIIKHDQSAVV